MVFGGRWVPPLLNSPRRSAIFMKSIRSFLGHFRHSARARHIIVASSITALLSLQVVRGASQIWTGNGSDVMWSDIQDWLGIAAPGSIGTTANADVATFDAPIANTWGNSANPIVIDSSRNIGGINFDTAADSYFIGSTSLNTLNVSSGGAIQILSTLTAPNAVEMINAPLQIQGAGGTYTLANNSANGGGAGTGTLNVGGGITGGASGATVLTLSGSNTNANTVSGVIAKGAATSLPWSRPAPAPGCSPGRTPTRARRPSTAALSSSALAVSPRTFFRAVPC